MHRWNEHKVARLKHDGGVVPGFKPARAAEDDARARTSGASSAKAACDASAGDQNSVSFSLDPYESIKSVNLLLGHKPPGLKQPSKGNITSANTEMITVRVALKKWYEWASTRCT